jgi:DNA-directed RNA polymerase delta subunit
MKPHELFLLYEKEVAQFKLELIRRLSCDTSTLEETRQKRTSNLSMIEAVLVAAGKPLHVNDIIAAIKKEFSITLDRDSLSSAIIKQVRKEKRFLRVAPNTFSLRQT